MKKLTLISKYAILGIACSLLVLPFMISGQQTDNEHSNELIILWQDNVSDIDKDNCLSTYNGDFTISSEYDNFTLISAKDCATAQLIHEDLSRKTSLCTIDYNADINLCKTDDPYFGTQWGLDNPGYYDQLVNDNLVTIYSTADVDMNIPESWSFYSKNNANAKQVVVAIIDTGVDSNHPDLAESMWVNTKEIPGDGIDNDKNGYIDDIFGWDFYNNDNTVCHYEVDAATDEIRASSDDRDDHGTHCAGIIAAAANNKIGIAGVASNIDVKIMALKIHGGPDGKGKIADAILAIKYASAMGADVVNMSWGSTSYNSTLEQAIKDAPMLFVTAAGNNGGNNDKTPVYPASFDLPNVISVTFINQYGYLTSKSNYGLKSVDIAAPGMDILSTAVGSSYATMSGSSMAAPHVTGLAAILYSVSKNISAENVKEVITKNYKPLVGLDNMIINPGIPDANLMVHDLASLKIDTTAPTLDISTYYEKDKIVIGVYGHDNSSGVCNIRYLSGKKSLSSFKKGTAGTPITSNRLELNKGGYYTFYIRDYANNESIVVYQVLDDTEAPLISTSYHYSIDGSLITVDVKAIDALSGVKQLKYTKGTRTIKDFSSGYLGTTLRLTNNTNTLRLSETGTYTFYVVDYRGNKTVHVLNVMANPIKSINVDSNSVSLTKGDLQKLKITYSPKITTDKIYYSSSNPAIVSISQWGALHAKDKGRAVITIKATSGVLRKILVTVN